MEKTRVDVERCKGCGLCASVCPTGAISYADSINEKGYNFAQIDQEKCIQCGMCYRTCPDYVITILDKES